MPTAGKAANVDEICAAVKKRNDEIANMTDDYMNVLRAKHVRKIYIFFF